ncbi:helix-turn-helix domain-containing protein [Lachnospiraceae bacterium TF09-5]|nr:helix-turn-helix domain-containing protein [Lachnospiraceae bacterium TF09-5]
MDAVLKLKRNANSDNACRKVDGHMEAQIVEIACGPVPEGHSRWRVRLLEKRAKIEFEEPVSREAIRRSLKITC